MVIGLVLILLFGPYLFFRVASFWERTKIICLPDVDIPVSTPDDSLTVVVWNIAHGRGAVRSNWQEKPEGKVRRVIEIAQFIKKLDADIVVLNEVDFSSTWSGGFDQAKAIARNAGFPYYARQCNLDFGFLIGRWQFGNVILSRYPILGVSAVDLPPFRDWEDWLVGRKRGLLCSIDLGKEGTIHVMGLHLEHRGEAIRLESARFLASQLLEIDGPLIVGGDLNTTPSSAPKANLTSSGDNAFDTLIELTGLHPKPLRVDDASQMTFPSWKPHTAIDWLLFSPDHFDWVDDQVMTSDLSDHLPVVTTLLRKRKPQDSNNGRPSGQN